MRQLYFSTVRFLFRTLGPPLPKLFARWGVALWGQTHRPAWRDWEHQILARATQKNFTLHGQNISVYEWGNGPQLILLAHGWNSRASHFKNLIERLLDSSYRVLAFDAIGHGHSSGHWTSFVQYQDLLQQLQKDYGPFHTVIGHSFGGFCLPYALTHGLQSQKAVLMATPDTFEWLYLRFINILKLPERVDKATRKLIETRFDPNCWQDFSAITQAKKLGTVKALILHDEDDQGVPIEVASHIKNAWPGSQLLVTRQLGHHRILRHPRALKPILEFIGEQNP